MEYYKEKGRRKKVGHKGNGRGGRRMSGVYAFGFKSQDIVLEIWREKVFN